MTDPVRSWHPPVLVSLTRNRPEETVLTVCKAGSGGISGPGPAYENFACWNSDVACSAYCNTVADS
jgi:hypothetical protein